MNRFSAILKTYVKHCIIDNFPRILKEKNLKLKTVFLARSFKLSEQNWFIIFHFNIYGKLSIIWYKDNKSLPCLIFVQNPPQLKNLNHCCQVVQHETHMSTFWVAAHTHPTNILKILGLFAVIQKDKTMTDRLMYIPNDDTQNHPFCRL